MRTLKFSCNDEFCDYVISEYYRERDKNEDNFVGVNIVAKYEIISPILNRLLDDFWFEGGYLHSYEYAFYEREFVLTINCNEEIWIEPAYDVEKDIYLGTGDWLTFVNSECSSRYVAANKEAPMIEFDIADEHECDCDCEEDDDEHDYELDSLLHGDDDSITLYNDDDELIGFSQSFSDNNNYIHRSFYSNSESIVHEMLKKWADDSNYKK